MDSKDFVAPKEKYGGISSRSKKKGSIDSPDLEKFWIKIKNNFIL